MLMRTYEGQNCSIADALEVVGERWTLLIVRDALLGLSRFDEFQRSLGISRKVLAERLRWLVDQGILERVRYQERPERHEYRLTQKGLDLHVTLIGLRQWGDTYCNEQPPLLARTKRDKKPVLAALIRERSDHLRLDEVELVPGPGARPGVAETGGVGRAAVRGQA